MGMLPAVHYNVEIPTEAGDFCLRIRCGTVSLCTELLQLTSFFTANDVFNDVRQTYSHVRL